MIDVVKTANAMGFYTIVADHVKGSPAKAFANKFSDESTAHVEKMVKLVHDENVDGIFTAFEDINTWHAEKIASETGLLFTPAKSNWKSLRTKKVQGTMPSLQGPGGS